MRARLVRDLLQKGEGLLEVPLASLDLTEREDGLRVRGIDGERALEVGSRFGRALLEKVGEANAEGQLGVSRMLSDDGLEELRRFVEASEPEVDGAQLETRRREAGLGRNERLEEPPRLHQIASSVKLLGSRLDLFGCLRETGRQQKQ